MSRQVPYINSLGQVDYKTCTNYVRLANGTVRIYTDADGDNSDNQKIRTTLLKHISDIQINRQTRTLIFATNKLFFRKLATNMFYMSICDQNDKAIDHINDIERAEFSVRLLR